MSALLPTVPARRGACVCVYIHVHAHTLLGGNLIMHEKGGEVYFKAIGMMLCHVAAGWRQQPNSNLPGGSPGAPVGDPEARQPLGGGDPQVCLSSDGRTSGDLWMAKGVQCKI